MEELISMTLMNNFNEKYFFSDSEEKPFDISAMIAEEKILEAIRNGEHEKLSCKGRPFELDNLNYIPGDRRVGYKILKNSGFLPIEMELKKEIYMLEKQISECTDKEMKEELKKQLNEKNVKCDIHLKGNAK
jgi:hypothetical protein